MLFLDFDGCLHPKFPGDGPTFTQLKLLEDVLRQVPEVVIVLSTSWRLQNPLHQLRTIFSPDIASRIIGMTPDPHDVDPTPELRHHGRQAEIDAWLRQNRRRNETWLALDDDSEGFTLGCENLVHCEPGRMLDEETAALLLRRLKKCLTKDL